MARQDLNQQLVTMMTLHQRSIYGYIVSLLGSPADADDVLQNTYLAIWRKSNEYHGEGKFTTWACRIAYFEVLAFRKKHRRETHGGFDPQILDQIATAAGDIVSEVDDRLEAMRECMANMDEASLKLLRMRYQQELSMRQIFESSERKTEGSVRVALHRIRQSLLDCIRKRMSSEASR